MTLHRPGLFWLLLPVLIGCGGDKGPTGPNGPVAAKLAIVVQPSTAVAGANLPAAVQVAVQDANGGVVAGSTATVTLAITSGTGGAGATLGGTLARAAVNGIATFPNLTLDKVGADYTLTASSSGLTSAATTPFSITAGAATQLAFTVQPATVTAGVAVAPGIEVTLEDALGNRAAGATGNVTLAITTGTGTAGATVAGSLTQAAVNGAATFADVTIDKVGTGYTLTASAPGLTSAVGTAFPVTVGPAAKLAFTTEPSAAAQGVVIDPAVQVVVQDAPGNTVFASTAPITLAISAGTGTIGAAIGGTLTLPAAGGAAAFADVSVSLPGTGYTFTASSPGLASATSTPFPVNGGTISGLISLSSVFVAPRPSAAAPTAPEGPATTPPEEFVPGELIVTYRAPRPAALSRSSAAAASTALRQQAVAQTQSLGAAVVGVSPATGSARIRVADPARLADVMAALRQDPAVATVERNGFMSTTARPSAAPTLPNDPAYVQQAWHYMAIDLDRAWAITTGSSSVLVAVVDDGIHFNHPAIAANLTADGYDFVASTVATKCTGGTVDLAGDGDGYDNDPTMPAAYSKGSSNCVNQNTGVANHGLHVAGTIGAVGNDGVGVTGVNWHVKIRPVRVLNMAGSGTFYDIAQGVLYAAGLPADNGAGGVVQAATGARLINMSLGGTGTSTVLQSAVQAASAAGSLIIAAAGNNNANQLFYPAAYPEVLAVTAVGPDLSRASYSNVGSWVDITAPGGDLGDGGANYGVYSTQWDFGANAPTYRSIDGTSMATPHVTGVAALLLAQEPSLTAAAVRARLVDYAVDIGIPGPDTFYGAGLLNARNSLTQTMAAPATTYARLYDAATGKPVRDVTTGGNGAFSFDQVPAGTYWVFAGQDDQNDGQIGRPGLRWSAAGGTTTPTTITIAATATQTVNLTLGYASETEPNNAFPTANPLPVRGYLFGTASGSDTDFFSVQIATAGQYTFETTAFRGACGFADELDTVLDLYDANGNLLATNADINAAGLNFCSRIVRTMTPGKYYAVVRGFGSKLRRYYLSVRAE